MKRERRKFTNEFKAEVALEAIKEKLTMVELAMKYKVNPLQIKAWKKEFLDNKASFFLEAKAAPRPNVKRNN
jgi:transposase